MAIAHGFKSIIGVGSEVTLGTPVAATQRVAFSEESISANINEVMDNSLQGSAARSLGQQGTRIIEGGFSYQWRAGLGDLVLARFFGTTTADTPASGQTCYSLDPSIDGDGLTVAIEKSIAVFEWSGFKTSQLTISGNPGDGIVIACEGFAKSLDLSSVLNTSSSLDALSELGNILLFQDMVFRVADLTGALQTSDAIEISDFSIELNRGLEPVEVNSRNRTEALENAFRESTLKFTVPQYYSNFFVDAHENHTTLQMDMVITSGANVKTIQSPLLIVLEYTANIGGPEFVTHEITCQIIPDRAGLNAFMTLQDTSSEIEIIEE